MAGARRALALAAGPLLALLVWWLLPGTYVAPDGATVALDPAARGAAAVTAWMAWWWIAEPVAVYVTALLPLALFPLLGIAPAAATATAYGDPLVFLFFGGFIIALALERWELHRRLALAVLRAVSPRPDALVAAFMGIAAFISLWVSNTATTLMLLPVVQSVLRSVPDPGQQPDVPADLRMLAPVLLLGVAYAASIGGMGTIIGTAPNVFVASYLRNELGVEIGFISWMAVALPLVLVLLPAAWWVLVRVIGALPREPLPGAAALLDRLGADLGPLPVPARRTLWIFLLTAATWVVRPWLVATSIDGWQPLGGLTDTTVAVAAAIALFVTPAGTGAGGSLMDWDTAARLPWGLLILFGGGLALAAALGDSGFARFLAAQGAALRDLPVWMLVGAVVVAVVFLSEVASNAATAATVVPILAAVAGGMGAAPVPLVLAACFAASCGFMLPVATPPNAIAYGTGQVPARLMARAGLLLNLLGILFITLLTCGIIIPLQLFG